MKKFRVLALTVLIIAMSMQSAFASSMFTIYGKAEVGSEDAVILVLNSGADINNVQVSDIKYADQLEIGENGYFSVTLPLLEDIDIYSNKGDLNSTADGEGGTVYVSSSTGNDASEGLSADAPVKTLEAAYNLLFRANEIVLMDDVTYVEPPAHIGELTIKGNTADVTLNMTSTASLNGDLTLDNLVINGASTIFANGYTFKVTESVTSTAVAGDSLKGNDRLTVYGGKNSSELVGDTNLILLGGKFTRVYGGGYNSAVTGSTNIVMGGTVNIGDNIDDDTELISSCFVYGGGYNGAVSGSTNITVQDSATIRFIYGTGTSANGTTPETNININGGQVMNVYGGALNADRSNITTNVTMTAGTVEALFGGCQSGQLTGNTNVTIKGGKVLRRVYSGCYNNWEGSWDSKCYVTGNTSLVIYPEAVLLKSDELSSVNALDIGVYAGSRVDQNYAGECNTLIFLDDCYSSQNGHIGNQDTGFASTFYPFESYADYTVMANAGGEVATTATSGTVKITPDNGYDFAVNGTTYEKEADVALTQSLTTVTFTKRDFKINDLDAENGETEISGTANITADNTTGEIDPKLFVTVYEKESGVLIDCSAQAATTGDKTFTLTCEFEQGKEYIVKAMILNGSQKPLTSVYSISLK